MRRGEGADLAGEEADLAIELIFPMQWNTGDGMEERGWVRECWCIEGRRGWIRSSL